MRNVIFLCFVLLTNFAYTQQVVVSGKVYSLEGKPVQGVTIINQEGKVLLDSTDANGVFSVQATIDQRIGFDKAGFELKWIQIKKDVKEYRVVLDTEIQEIDAIVITRRNSEEALDIKNVNIIHYQPLDGAILTLKKEKYTYYLGLDSLRQEGPTFALDIDRPKELYFDCFKNAYILSTDSAYQFLMSDTGVMILSVIPMPLFDEYIRPCVSKFENRLIFEKFSKLSKEYHLTIFEEEQPKVVFEKFDLTAYQGAFEASLAIGKMVDPLDGDTLVNPIYLDRVRRRDIYGRHDSGGAFNRSVYEQKLAARAVEAEAASTFNSASEVQSGKPPEMTAGSPDAWSASRGKSFAEAMALFILLSQPLEIQTFQMGNFAVVVDSDSNFVHVLDHFGYHLNTSSINISADIKNVLQDKATGYLYLYVRDKGNHKVYGLDAFTGRVSYLKNFGGMPDTKQAVIYDGYLYYKVLERDFYGINRVRLPKMDFFSEVD